MSRLLLALVLFACTTTKDVDGAGDTATEETSPYVGGWPFNPDKDDLGDPPWTPPGQVGDQVPHFMAVDQYGDTVDLYDLGGHGVPIVIDMGTIFCAPCKDLAAYLSDGDMSHLIWGVDEETGENEYYPWWGAEYEGLREFVAAGEVYWVTVLFNESASGPSSEEECAAWHEEFPNPYIPVLADSGLKLKTWLGIESYPTLNLLNSEMVLEIHSTSGPFAVLRHLGEMLNDE